MVGDMIVAEKDWTRIFMNEVHFLEKLFTCIEYLQCELLAFTFVAQSRVQ